MSVSSKRVIPPAVRRSVLERDGHACQECGDTKQKGASLHLHHVIPEKFGGSEVPNNLITLCDIHHNARHLEFQAYYPASRSVFARMASFTRRLLKNIGLTDNNRQDNQLTALLRFLTDKDSFRPGQEEVIRSLVDGKDVLFVTPTGSGKSICYQVPGLLQDSPTLVISPLKTLLRDQVSFLVNKKVPATYVDSDVGTRDKANRIRLIRDKVFRFVFLTPERFFWTPLKADHPLLIDYGLLVIDEAHCIDKWGRHFRPSYSQLGKLRTALKQPPTLALTASASAKVQTRILKSLGIPSAKRVVTGFHRSEIKLEVRHFDARSREAISRRKLELLKATLRNEDARTIVFVPTVAIGKRVLEYLSDAGVEADFFHSRLDKEKKTIIQNRYTGKTEPPLNVLIATSAFGMGMNIPDIRLIIHWSIPANIEDYYQQIGRAGRDGRTSKAILFYAPGDEGLVRFMNEKPLETKPGLTKSERGKLLAVAEGELQGMLRYVFATDKWKYILDYFGELNQPQGQTDHGDAYEKYSSRYIPRHLQGSGSYLSPGDVMAIVVLVAFIAGLSVLIVYLASQL